MAVTTVFISTLFFAAAEKKLFLLGGAQSSRFAAIDQMLAAYVLENGRLPCPADPAAPLRTPYDPAVVGVANAGTAVPAGGQCAYPAGVVPWRTLGMSESDATDSWGKLISYRVYDGQYGLVQPNGMNAIDCDTTNAYTGDMGTGGMTETAPDTYGLCNADHNTLFASFLAYAAAPYTKGLKVSNLLGTVLASDAAYVLISHGETGRGAYTSSGSRTTLPTMATGEVINIAAAPTSFIQDQRSDKAIAVDDAAYFDDDVSYTRISDVLKLAKRNARDWPDSIFNAQTTSNMTSASLDPSNPHFMSTGSTVTGQAFTATTDASGTTLQAGTGVGSFAACLWWPNQLTLVSNTVRRKFKAYVEFAATDNTSDPFPGFTMGFLSGNDAAGPPTNTTCGTGITVTTTAVGAAGQRNLIVASTASIAFGQRVFGNGIPFNATVSWITPETNTVQISSNITSTVAGLVSFADGNTVRRDLGWEGGTLDAYTNRFAVEFDANRDSTASIPAGNDPTRPHLSVDYGGVVHGTDAEACTTLQGGFSCDSQVSNFPSVTTSATGTTGSYTITVDDVSGIASGMTVTAIGIPFGTTVVSFSGKTLTLSQALSGSVSGSVVFSTLATSNFMQNGTGVFHSMRVEISPKDCVQKTGTGVQGQTTISVPDTTHLQSGMAVYGRGIAPDTVIQGISGTTLTLTYANSSTVSGDVVFAGGTPVTVMATGASGTDSLSVSSATGISVGLAAYGSGVGSGALVTNVSGTTVTLSVANTGAINGYVSFSPPRTLVKSWTLSNAGCAQDASACAALKDIGSDFGSSSLAIVRSATGSIGGDTLSVANASGIQVGMAVSGRGIGASAHVSSISGSTIGLSVSNSASVATDVVFRNRQVLHSVACVPSATVANAYDSLYFGLTTSNVTTSSITSKTAVGALGAMTITVSSNTSIVAGMSVRGTGIGNDAVVTDISGNTVTLSVANAGAVSGTVTFAGGANVKFREFQIRNSTLP